MTFSTAAVVAAMLLLLTLTTESAAAQTYTPVPGNAQRAWAWVELPQITNPDYTVFSAQAVNNSGHILARFNATGQSGGGTAFVYRDGEWKPIQNPNGSGLYYATTINNNDLIIGYYGSGENAVGVEWAWLQSANQGNGEYVVSATTWPGYWLKGINDYDEMVGFEDDSNDYPYAWLSSAQAWINLPGLNQSVHGTVAYNLNSIAGAGADIVGLSNTFSNYYLPVVWTYDDTYDIYVVNPLDATGYTTITDVLHALSPRKINDNRWIVGAVYDGTNSHYKAWKPTGTNQWSNVMDLGTSTFGTIGACGINNSDEIVANKNLYWDDGSTSPPHIDVVNFSTMHINSGEHKAIDRTSLAFTDINDNGWIIGAAKHKDDSTWCIGVLVPYNRNNNYDANTGNPNPDYREILSDPMHALDQSGGGVDGTSPDLVLDSHSTQYLRVGMYPLGDWGNNQLVDNIQIGRLHTDYCDLYAILNSQNLPGCNSNSTCVGFQNGLNTLFGIGNAGQPKELIATIRCKNPNDATGKTDYIPEEGSADETQKLNDLRDICAKYCRDLDFVQLGNELFGGPGQYYVNLGGDCGDGLLGNMDDFHGNNGQCYIDSHDAVFKWMQKQADVVVSASALAGRPLELVSHALFYSQVLFGYDGDLSNLPGNLDFTTDGPGNDRNAYSVKRVIDFANANFAVTDIHLHYTTEARSPVDNITLALDELENPDGAENPIWAPPASVGCTEWSPIPTYQGDNSWMRVNGDTLARYMRVDDRNAPTLSWDGFVTNWLFTEFHRTDFDGLLGEDLSLFNSRALRFACYGQFGQGPVPHHMMGGQTIADPDQWMLTPVSADMIKTSKLTDPDNPVNTVVERALQSAAANYVIQNWNPHPNGVQAECGN